MKYRFRDSAQSDVQSEMHVYGECELSVKRIGGMGRLRVMPTSNITYSRVFRVDLITLNRHVTEVCTVENDSGYEFVEGFGHPDYNHRSRPKTNDIVKSVGNGTSLARRVRGFDVFNLNMLVGCTLRNRRGINMTSIYWCIVLGVKVCSLY